MKKTLLIHIVLFLLSAAIFYAAGLIDKDRLESSDKHWPRTPYFAYAKSCWAEGDTIEYQSFAYHAFDTIPLKPVQDAWVGGVGTYYQVGGVSWEWKHMNLLFVAGVFIVSFTVCVIAGRLRKNVAEQVMTPNGP